MNASIKLRSRLHRLEEQKGVTGVAGFVASNVDTSSWRQRVTDLHALGYRVVYVAHIPKRDATARREPDATTAR